MLEAILVGCCLGAPIALGVLTTLIKGRKGQPKQDTSQSPKIRGRR